MFLVNGSESMTGKRISPIDGTVGIGANRVKKRSKSNWSGALTRDSAARTVDPNGSCLPL